MVQESSYLQYTNCFKENMPFLYRMFRMFRLDVSSFELLFMNKVAKWQYTTGDNEHSRINLKAVKKKKKCTGVSGI